MLCGPPLAAIIPTALPPVSPMDPCGLSATMSAFSPGKRSAAGAAAKRWVISKTMRNALLLGFLLLLGGCGPAGQVKTYPVKGTVKFEGKPMVGGGAISLI